MSAAAPGGIHRCRACAAEVRDGAARCDRCGAPQGPFTPCPHCRGEGGVSPDRELRFVCDLCGGPRVPQADGSIKLSGREAPLLRKADEARKARGVWRGAAVGAALALVLTVIPFVLLLIMVGPVPLLMLPGILFTALFGGLLAMAVSRAGARGREIAPALDAAWIAATGDVARQISAPLSAQDLSLKLGIEEAQAEELLALVDVNEALGGVTARRGRVRIEAASPATEAQAEAAAEEEAALAGEAAEQRKANQERQR